MADYLVTIAFLSRVFPQPLRAAAEGLHFQFSIRVHLVRQPPFVSVDSTVARAHHHAAGMAVEAGLLEELEKAAREEKGLHQRGK